MSATWCKDHVIKGKSGVLLQIHAQPGAGRTESRGIHGDRLKIALKAPPVDGAANEALIEYFSSHFSVPRSRVHLIRGEASRQKTIWIEGLNQEVVFTALRG